MNKSELVEKIASISGSSKVAAEKSLSATIQAITEALTKGDSVSLIGFGSFLVRDRAARVGRNPATKEVIQIPATKVPAFKAGSGLKAAVKGKKK
jgi:DNA-binding protein HU-beta